MKILFFLAHDGSIRNFERVLLALVARGHHVHLSLAARRALLMSEAESIEQLCREHPWITWDRMPKVSNVEAHRVLEGLARGRNYLRYLEPDYVHAHKLRHRAATHAPRFFLGLADRPLLRSEPGRRVLDRALRTGMTRLPTAPELDRYVRKHGADVALFTPLVGFGATQHSALRSVKAAGIPSALLVHSWDNLTNKGLLHEAPDRVVVWNDAQRSEAIELHAVPPDRVVVTGAHSYDDWFDWVPQRSREEFCQEVGLDPQRPLILYVCSSPFIAPDEIGFVRRWIQALRCSGLPSLDQAGIVVRPHPQNLKQWREGGLAGAYQVCVWPPVDGMVTGHGPRAAYFDSIHHACAVVGINTSALIEAAIQRRPVFTVLAPEFEETQTGTLHFAHLAGASGNGLLSVAPTLERHAEQLAEALAGPAEAPERTRAFLEGFVRPFGLDVPAVPYVVEAVEQLGASARGPVRRPGGRRATALALASATRFRRRRRLAETTDSHARRRAGRAAQEPLRVLFFMRSVNFDRHFEAILSQLLEDGHTVHVSFDVRKKGRQGDTSLLDSLKAKNPRLSYAVLPPRTDLIWKELAEKLRLSIDYLRYLEPEFASARTLRARAESRVPALTSRFGSSRLGRRPSGRRSLDTALRVLEQALPPNASARRLMLDFDPDLVLVSPLVGLGSPQGDYLRSAKALGIPTALLVASWDNLTNKGVIRDEPDLTVVWNEAQALEAVCLHGLRRDRILAAGAHTYDHWFTWTPRTSREAFCRKVGLDPARPYVLYTCSSSFIAPFEASFVAAWLRRLRESEDGVLRDVGVLVRPHPANARMWDDVDLTEPGRIVVYPRQGATPTSLDRKADYFDSIFHAHAVVGINTSALVESAIVGRRVYTVLAPEFHGSQEGTLHFAHLSDVLTIADSFSEHEQHLGEAARRTIADDPAAARFVDRFIRPLGRDEPVAPRVVGALEELAATAMVAKGSPFWHRPVRKTLGATYRVTRLLGRTMTVLGYARSGSKERQPRVGGQRNRILFVLDHPGLLIHFDETIAGLAERGNDVQLVFSRTRKFGVGLDVLQQRGVAVGVHRKSVARQDRYVWVSQRVRAAADFIHYLDPGLRDARYARTKWGRLGRLPRPLAFLERRESLPSGLVRLLLGALAASERAIPSAQSVDRFLWRLNPDVVIVSPLVDARSNQTEYVKSAQALGIPTALCVTSWDNLTSKGLIRLLPERVTVWNDTQRDEAIRFHGVPSERIVVTGAQPFDRWFGRDPRTSRAEFLRRFGLPHDKPMVLFVGSTRQGQDALAEPAYVRWWLQVLRSSADERLRELSVLVRPHPTNAEGWLEADLTGLGDVAVWQREEPLPVREGDRSDYFDALHHCDAVMGINSSAMIEAAILGRPVHTVELEEFHRMQRDLLHYHYLLAENGGFLCASTTWEQHAALLADDLADPRKAAERARGFVEPFVRPHGLDQPATERLIEAIEGVSSLSVLVPGQNTVVKLFLRGALLSFAARRRAHINAHHSLLGRSAVVQQSCRAAAERAAARAGESEGGQRVAWKGLERLLANGAGGAEAVGSRSERFLIARKELRPPKPVATEGEGRPAATPAPNDPPHVERQETRPPRVAV